MAPPSLAGVLIYTSRVRFGALRAFYVEVLELTPRTDREGFVNFEFGDQRLTIAVHDAVADMTKDPNRIMINFATNDIDSSYTTAVSAGAPAIRPPSPEPWGGRVATIADPDGNLVQFLELP